MKTFYAIAAMLIQIVLGFAPVVIVKAALETKAGIGRIVRGASKLGDSATGKARDRARSSNYYQNKEMIRQARANERRRGNIASYSDLMTGNGLRSEMARRRAAGGVGGMVFNTNRVGQDRIRASAEDQLRRERHEETERAAKMLAQQGFEGDTDFMAIARNTTGTYRSARTGNTVQVTDAVRQAAVNALVQQGRTGQLRDLEADGGGRGPGGVARTAMHETLDHAYEEYGQKLADKAPDLMPSRRTTNGVAAFTDLKPKDIAGWHHSTVAAARNFYNTSRMVEDVDPATGLGLGTFHDQAPIDREQMLRAFGQATTLPSAQSDMSLDQVRQVRAVLQDAQAAAAAQGQIFDQQTAQRINDMYTNLGGV